MRGFENCTCLSSRCRCRQAQHDQAMDRRRAAAWWLVCGKCKLLHARPVTSKSFEEAITNPVCLQGWVVPPFSHFRSAGKSADVGLWNWSSGTLLDQWRGCKAVVAATFKIVGQNSCDFVKKQLGAFGLHATPVKGLLEMYSKRVARANASSSRSVAGYATAPSAEVTGSNSSENRVRFWFAKVANSNRTWVLLVFETHNFGTGRTNDYVSFTWSQVRTRS